ncbi:unnamed protein product [Sphagnum jensenii]|uniref:J domain-containing protein n=1 Tax=Sphagnum jensenii TaxID=128206 RepID=A0ABP0X463_9BRYO
MLTLRERAVGFLLLNSCKLMSTRTRAFTISSSKPDEWWAIDGQIHRLRPPLSGDLHTIVNMEVPNPRPKPISAKQRLSNRNRLVSQIRIRNDGGQESYWKAYMERFQKTREEWEKLHWDGIPKEPASNLELKTPRLDHYQVLGLRKRHRPYSPLELKAAFRDKAMQYHPSKSVNKSPKNQAASIRRFKHIWEAYKNLQNKRSW